MKKLTGLRLARLKAGKTMQDVATRLKISGSTLHYYEMGAKTPSQAALKRLATIYKCQISDLTND